MKRRCSACGVFMGSTHSCSEPRYRNGETNPNWRGGKYSHPLYWIYQDMIARCNRPTHKRYNDYGARGVTVCDRWRNDFWNFVADMWPRPSELKINGRSQYHLDRVDNDSGYSPENCRWANLSVSAKNRRPDRVPRRRNEKGRFL